MLKYFCPLFVSLLIFVSCEKENHKEEKVEISIEKINPELNTVIHGGEDFKYIVSYFIPESEFNVNENWQIDVLISGVDKSSLYNLTTVDIIKSEGIEEITGTLDPHIFNLFDSNSSFEVQVQLIKNQEWYASDNIKYSNVDPIITNILVTKAIPTEASVIKSGDSYNYRIKYLLGNYDYNTDIDYQFYVGLEGQGSTYMKTCGIHTFRFENQEGEVNINGELDVDIDFKPPYNISIILSKYDKNTQKFIWCEDVSLIYN